MERNKKQILDNSQYFEEVLKNIHKIRERNYTGLGTVTDIIVTTVDYDSSGDKLRELLISCQKNVSIKDPYIDDLELFANYLLSKAEEWAEKGQVMTMSDVEQLSKDYRREMIIHKNDAELVREQLSETLRQKADLGMKYLAAKKRILDLERRLKKTEIKINDLVQKKSNEILQYDLMLFVKYTKRKNSVDRKNVKMMLLEFTKLNSIYLSKDLRKEILGLDDEVKDPKNVTIQGNYIDIHENKEVKFK